MGKRKRFPYWMTLLTVLLIGTASWAVYSLINEGASDILTSYGIENTYYQLLIVIGVILVILLFLGFRLKKSFDRIIKG